MTPLHALLLATAAILVLVVGAVWPAQWWHIALVLAGPVFCFTVPFAVVYVPWVVFTVTPMLAYRRPWARVAVPVAVVVVCALFILGDPPIWTFVGVPVGVALVALGRRLWTTSGRRRTAAVPVEVPRVRPGG